MKTNTCQKCNNEFNCHPIINGKKIHAYNRKFCFNCSPYGEHNTSSLKYNTKPSLINQLSLSDFKELVNSCYSRTQCFDKLNLHKTGGAFKIFNQRLLVDNIDISHFKQAHEFDRNLKLITDDKIFCRDSTYAKGALKRKIIKHKYINYCCSICNNLGIHQNLPLVLQLDHINGINSDNRLENLRFLCPNCHSQTSTFSRRNIN